MLSAITQRAVLEPMRLSLRWVLSGARPDRSIGASPAPPAACLKAQMISFSGAGHLSALCHAQFQSSVSAGVRRENAAENMSVTLHTTLGPIKLEVFCESVPKTAEVRPGALSPFPLLTAAPPSRTSSPSAHPATTMARPFTVSFPPS